MRLMIDRGSVEIRPGRGGGIFVNGANPVVRLRHTLLTVRSDPSTVSDAITIREALEPLVDSDAARHRTKSDISDLERLLKSMEDASGDTDAFIRANWSLHERIAEITPNAMLKAVYISMTHVLADLSDHAAADASDTESRYFERRLEVHRQLIEAIVAGDVDAVAIAVARHSA
jgi:DNA-binding FadR family transcriptional regulator